ncbi:MAG: hypothetical protein A2V67_01210 [Deltaproteobacteria bacterium RBG_13_61_14]|nr:MAG: hypothetical protein A2V67_01210 [Deltaproteobacteria bacterium RBG_13_61_14]
MVLGKSADFQNSSSLQIRQWDRHPCLSLTSQAQNLMRGIKYGVPRIARLSDRTAKMNDY